MAGRTTLDGGTPGARYSSVSIALHWMLAVLLLLQIWIGGWFEDLPRGPEKGEAFGLHASVGATILALSLLRLVWRLTHPAPPLPTTYAPAVRVLARVTHVLLYWVMIGMPLSGWAAASTSGDPLPDVWGLIPFPRLPVTGDAAHETAELLHVGVLLNGFWVLLALHVAGALKHHLIDRDTTLWRMLPLVRPRGPGPR